MAKKLIETRELHRPLGAYSHVVEGVGARMIFISGQAPLDVSGNLVGQDDMAAQVGQVMKNLSAALDSVGGTPGDICKITIFLTEAVAHMPDGLAGMRKGLKEFFGEEPPASSLAYVSRLASPDWFVEIEAYAMV